MYDKKIKELEEIVDLLTSKVGELQDGLDLTVRELERLENELCDKEDLTSAVREIQIDLQRAFPKLIFYRSV